MTVDKTTLRRVATARRAALDPAARQAASAAIGAAVTARLLALQPSGLMVYAAMRDEVDPAAITAAALAAGLPLAYPLIDWTTRLLRPIHLRVPERLQPGRFGVPEPPLDQREPFEPDDLAIVLVPGLAFDARGYRLGYGAGMYDQLLGALPARTLRWGLAFEAQLVDRVPDEAHDQPLDAVVTETRWIETEARHG